MVRNRLVACFHFHLLISIRRFSITTNAVESCLKPREINRRLLFIIERYSKLVRNTHYVVYTKKKDDTLQHTELCANSWKSGRR